MGVKEETGHTAYKNFWNFCLMIVVGLPSVLFTRDMFYNCAPRDTTSIDPFNGANWARGNHEILHMNAVAAYREWKPTLCALTYQAPVTTVNLIFFVNICVLFWIVGRIIDSDWLIDPYWTIAPPMIALFYALHPNARPDVLKSGISLGLLFAWSIRLTHSYFRREEWNFGAREDWRFTQMRSQYGKHWWWICFFICYLSQQAMLCGITLPYYAIYIGNDGSTFGLVDVIATVGGVAGLLIAYVGDTAIRDFITTNERRKKEGLKPLLILDSGIFRYSRHPNHFGEQLFWWCLALFGVSSGHVWTIVGTAFNTAVMLKVGYMVEERMYSKPERAAAYRAYVERTSYMIPWPPRKGKTA